MLVRVGLVCFPWCVGLLGLTRDNKTYILTACAHDGAKMHAVSVFAVKKFPMMIHSLLHSYLLNESQTVLIKP